MARDAAARSDPGAAGEEEEEGGREEELRAWSGGTSTSTVAPSCACASPMSSCEGERGRGVKVTSLSLGIPGSRGLAPLSRGVVLVGRVLVD